VTTQPTVWLWQVSRTYYPRVRRAYGKRTRPHTFYQTFEDRDDAYAFYRGELSLTRNLRDTKVSIQQVNSRFVTLTRGQWYDARSPEKSKRRKARREDSKREDESRGFKLIRTRPTGHVWTHEFSEGERVKLVHLSRGWQRTYGQELIGCEGVVDRVYPGTVYVLLDGINEKHGFKPSSLEKISDITLDSNLGLA
jgi:hypothetical protein